MVGKIAPQVHGQVLTTITTTEKNRPKTVKKVTPVISALRGKGRQLLVQQATKAQRVQLLNNKIDPSERVDVIGFYYFHIGVCKHT
jgi:hypothetical protein